MANGGTNRHGDTPYTHADAQLAGLDRLFRPRSIAIAGAHPDPKTTGGTILANCERFAFPGPIHLISPTRTEIAGRPCIASADDLPEGVDAVVLNVPKAAILDSARSCAERGVGGLVVFAAGFSEAGGDGVQLQEELAAICRNAGMAMLGPNCLGFTNFRDGVALSFEPVSPISIGQRRSVSVIAQSGAVNSAIRQTMLGRGISVSLAAATGNEAVTTTSDVIDFIVSSKGSDAIIVYAEQIRNPPAFLAAASRARKAGIPIIMFHPGRSARGREAAMSHTGSMVSNHAVMRTAVEREAVVVVDSLDALLDTAALLHRFPKPQAGKLAVVTNSGAVRGMTFDFAEDVELELAPIAQSTRDALAEMLPAGMEIDNPLDIGITAFVDATIFRTSTEAMLADPAVGGALISVTGGAPAQQRAKAEAIVPVARATQKPVAMAVIGDGSPLDPDFVATMHDAEIPLYRSPERAMQAFSAASRYADALGAEDRSPASGGLVLPDCMGVLPEYRGKQLLRSIGLTVPEGELVGDIDTAVQIARTIGFPVVIKAQAAALAHKSEAGGVLLNIADEAALREAWVTLMANVHGTSIDGVLVERMSAPGLEMILGATRDPEWGASVLVGMGGVMTEALEATMLLPADVTHGQVLIALSKLRGAKLLGPFRGKPARDTDAIAHAVVKLGGAIRADERIQEIEVNPLTVGAKGEGAIALDALVILR